MFSHLSFLLSPDNMDTSAVFETHISNCWLSVATYYFHWHLKISKGKTQRFFPKWTYLPAFLISVKEAIFQLSTKVRNHWDGLDSSITQIPTSSPYWLTSSSGSPVSWTTCNFSDFLNLISLSISWFCAELLVTFVKTRTRNSTAFIKNPSVVSQGL